MNKDNLIVVICANMGTADILARMIQDGELPKLYTSVEHARETAKAFYPAPQLTRYRIYAFEDAGETWLPVVADEPILK